MLHECSHSSSVQHCSTLRKNKKKYSFFDKVDSCRDANSFLHCPKVHTPDSVKEIPSERAPLPAKPWSECTGNTVAATIGRKKTRAEISSQNCCYACQQSPCTLVHSKVMEQKILASVSTVISQKQPNLALAMPTKFSSHHPIKVEAYRNRQ